MPRGVYPRTEAHRLANSQARVGKRHSEERRKRNSESKKGRVSTNFVDGRSKHPLYTLWHNMMSRCYTIDSRHYAGKGIVVCEEWHDPWVFYEFVETNLGACPEGHSLDRIDNDGNYEPSNVRWATQSEQMLNSGRRQT